MSDLDDGVSQEGPRPGRDIIQEQLDDPSNPIGQAYRQVPEIGRGRRWYDWPYKLLNGLWASRLGRKLPYSVRRRLFYSAHYFLPWNVLDRDRAWSLDDPRKNLKLPADESVRIPGIWVAELFPPSEIESLKRSMGRNGWDKRRIHFVGDEIAAMLAKSRQGGGWHWWRIGEEVGEHSTGTHPDAIRRKLPKQFEVVEHVALQVGDGLTAVISHFELTPAAMRIVDEAWHRSYEPRIVRDRGKRRNEDRLWSWLAQTQASRRQLHNLARGWMKDVWPGSFAHSGELQPLYDLVLLDKYDPSIGERLGRTEQDALRALGIMDSRPTRLTSPELPGLMLESVDSQMCRAFEGDNTWTLWGQAEKASTIRDLSQYTGELHRATAHVVGERVRDMFLRLALSDFLRLKREQNSQLRDNARIQHGQYSRKDLKELRDSCLTNSLDTSSIARDIDGYFERTNFDITARFFKSVHLDSGEPGEPLFDVIEGLAESQKKSVQQLVEFDTDYRDILSTVSSLGSSIYAFKVQKYAIGIAFLSIVIAVIALLSEDARAALGETLWGWVTAIWPD